MKILVTGFDPFGNEKINPAIESVKRLPDVINEATIIKLEINTVAFKSLSQIEDAIKQHSPDVVLSVGQAGGRFGITVEKVAINYDDFRIPDNEGNQFIDRKIFNDGPTAYFATLPIKAMVENIKNHNIPASVSYTAGTFICNHVFYGISHLAATKYPKIKAGFIHIPFLIEQVVDKKDMPSMDLNTLVKALTHAIEAIVDNDEDITVIGGAIH